MDPLAEKYYYNSPYAFSENKVTSHVELEGLEAESIKKIGNGFKGVANKLTDRQTYQEIRRGFIVLAEKMGLGKLLFAKNLPKDNTPKKQDGDGINIYSDKAGPDHEYVPTADPNGNTTDVKKEYIDAMTHSTKSTTVPSPGDVGEAIKNIATSIEKGTKAGKILIENVSTDKGQTIKVEVDSIKYAGDSRNFSWPTVSIDGKDTTFQVSKP